MVKKTKIPRNKVKLEESNQSAIETAPILKKLLGLNSTDTAWAAAAISNLVQQPDTLQILVANNVIGNISSVLSSHTPEIQVELAGALRNIAVYGGPDLCKEMYRKSVFVALFEMLPKIAEMIEKVIEGDLVEEQKDAFIAGFNLAEQVFHLMSHISEAHMHAFKEVESNTTVLPTLMRALTHANKFPLQFIISVGQLSLLLTETSTKLHHFYRNNRHLVAILISIANGTSFPTLRQWNDKSINVPLICAGILYNIRQIFETKNGKKDLKELLSAVQCVTIECCNLDLSSVVKTGVDACKSQIASVNENIPENKHVDECEDILETLLIAVELLTNVYSNEGHDEEERRNIDYGALSQEKENAEEDIEFAYENKEELEYEKEEYSDEDSAFNMMQEESIFEDDDTLMEHIPSKSIDSLLSNLVQFSECNLPSPLKVQSRQIAYLLYSIKSASFGAISNLIEKCDSVWVKTNCTQLWEWLFQQAILISQQRIAFEDESTIDSAIISDVTENIVTALWMLITRVSTVDASLIASTLPTVTAFIQTTQNKTASETIRAKCICVLSHLARRQNQVSTNKLIGEMLMELLLEPCTSVLLLSETLNALFDIYADEDYDYDCVFRDSGYLRMIKGVSGSIQAKVKSLDKRKYREIREQADEAIINMKAFIIYKETEYYKRGLKY